MKLSKQQLKTSTRHYIKKCAGAVCTSKLHESARNSRIPRDNFFSSYIFIIQGIKTFISKQIIIELLELAIWPFDLFTWSSLAGQAWWSLLKKGFQ